VGRGVPLGAGRELSLRLRVLAAAAGIVAVSLLLSGALTWVLVRNLELQTAQGQLDVAIQADLAAVRHEECRNVPRIATNQGPAGCIGAGGVDDPIDFQDRLTALAATLSQTRLLLLDGGRVVIWDSGTPSAAGQVISVQAARRVGNVAEAQPTLGGQTYLAAATALAPARDPLNAAFLVVARPRASVTSAAVGTLVPLLLLAGGAGDGGGRLQCDGAPDVVVDMMAELVGKARERILVIVHEIFDIEVRGLARARHPHTNEARLVVGEHHSVLHSGAFGLALRSAGPSTDAVAVDRESPAEAGAPSQPFPQALSAGEPFASAVPGEPHRRPGKARPIPVRAGLGRVMPNWRLVVSLPAAMRTMRP